MASIRELSAKSIWLDEGSIRRIGPSRQVINSYLKFSSKSQKGAQCYFPEDENKEFQVCAAFLKDIKGILTREFECDEPIIIEMQCKVRRVVPGLYGYLSISKMDGTTVLVSDSFDVPPNSLDGLSVGMHNVRIEIPARSLAPGEYVVYVNFTSISGIKGFDIDSPGNILSFRLEDNSSRRGNKRLGCFSTLIPWQVSQKEKNIDFPQKNSK